MKSVEFCYWLQGMFELSNPKALNAAQTELVKQHLAMVFVHEIDPSYPPGQQVKLDKLHVGTPKDPPVIGGKGPDGVMYRC